MSDVAFLDALSRSHRVIAYADLHDGDKVIYPSLPITGGRIQVSGSDSIRRQCNLEIIDEEGVLSGPDSLIEVGITELRPYRGLVLPDGTRDFRPLGVFRISSDDEIDKGNGITVSVQAYDRSRSVKLSAFEEPYDVQPGTNYATAIKNLVSSRMSGIEFQFTNVSSNTGLIVFEEDSDPWAAAQKMAKNIGCELFFDTEGRCVLRQIASANAAPVFEYAEGDRSTLLDLQFHQDDDPGYNAVKVTGEPADAAPVIAYVRDTDPNSPTNYYGRYGKRTYRYRSPLIYTQAQANAVAYALYQKVVGATEQVRFSAIPNPIQDAGDVIKVTRQALGIDELYIVESFTIPLDVGGEMDVVCRKRREAVVEDLE